MDPQHGARFLDTVQNVQRNPEGSSAHEAWFTFEHEKLKRIEEILAEVTAR